MSQKGRSMIEMLGVLAIIGVLSVGALEGYSRAMFKYKLNKQAEAMNALLNTAMQYSGKIANSDNYIDAQGAVYYAETFYKASLLPAGIKMLNVQFLEDMFNNRIWLYEYSKSRHSGMGYTFSKNIFGIEICYNLVEIAKQNSANIYRLVTDQVKEEGGNIETNEEIFGDKYCSEDKKCLSKITKQDLDLFCRSVLNSKTNGARFYISWKY